jgi:GNAT superfamily N-acetyltransferase
MASIRTLLGDRPPAGAVVLRPPRIGDLGWLVHRQALVYNQQFGWNADYEGLIAGIYSRFQQAPETPAKALWIAEQNGKTVGSVFVMPSEGIEGSAQLRMLYTEPEARGQGIGAMLVKQCIAFARDNGYERMRLWTHTIQESARRIYAAAGFEIVETMPEHNFGKEMTGEIWQRGLRLDESIEMAK